LPPQEHSVPKSLKGVNRGHLELNPNEFKKRITD